MNHGKVLQLKRLQESKLLLKSAEVHLLELSDTFA